MVDVRGTVLALLRDDVLTPWFNRADLAVIALDTLHASVDLNDVEAVISNMLSDGTITQRTNRLGNEEVALTPAT